MDFIDLGLISAEKGLGAYNTVPAALPWLYDRSGDVADATVEFFVTGV